MLQHALKLYRCLHFADVGADIIRPRATDSRPYKYPLKDLIFATIPFDMLLNISDPTVVFLIHLDPIANSS